MSPKTRHALSVAAIAVASTALCAIAAIQGWIPEWISGRPAARVAAAPPSVAAPVESLSPGESLIAETPRPAPPAPPPAEAPKPAASPPATNAAPPPAANAAPAAPARKAEKPPAPTKPKGVARTKPAYRCTNCGTVAATLHSDREWRGQWEVRVTFDDGNRMVLRYPTNPGFRVGDRVVLANGRLRRG